MNVSNSLAQRKKNAVSSDLIAIAFSIQFNFSFRSFWFELSEAIHAINATNKDKKQNEKRETRNSDYLERKQNIKEASARFSIFSSTFELRFILTHYDDVSFYFTSFSAVHRTRNNWIFQLQIRNQNRRMLKFIHWNWLPIDAIRLWKWHLPMFGIKDALFASIILAIKRKRHIAKKTLKVR